jgi:hypothetical protein
MEGSKVCTICKQEKHVTEFGVHRSRKDGRPSQCIACRRIDQTTRYHSDPIKERNRDLQRFHITHDDYEALLKLQGGVCALCKQPETSRNGYGLKRLSIDHDHKCCPGRGSCGQCIRALLCTKCNQGLGYFDDDPDLLEAAAAYLRATKG